MGASVEQQVSELVQSLETLRKEIGKVIVGNTEVVDGALICMLAGGHALLEGVPGLGKTMFVRTLAEALSLQFSRIQFTPDLMPADILGTTILEEDNQGNKSISFRKGPIFGNIILADEINRATPKTQSALLQAMQEQVVTVGGKSHTLAPPFLVLATQNPLEMEGTYPLPEAQLDRFLLKLQVPFPGRDELHKILERTTGSVTSTVQQVLDGPRIREMMQLVREVPVDYTVQDYAIRLLRSTHPDTPEAHELTKKFVRFGASPRGAQAVLMAAKILALFGKRFSASIDDVRKAALPALRHRVLLNFEGEAEGVKSDQVIEAILRSLPEVQKK